MIRALPLVTVLTGCTFYISGNGGGDGGPDSTAPDSAETVDAGIDMVTPPLGDAAIDTPIPDVLITFDSIVPPFDAFVPPDTFVPPDVITPPTWTVIETISVPCNGQTRTSQVLTASVTYHVRASGQCKVDVVFGSEIFADADFQGTVIPRDKDNGVDTGIAINDVTLGWNKFPNWGNYTSSHVYEISGPGQGAPIVLRYHDKANNAYGNNSGALTIEILALQ